MNRKCLACWRRRERERERLTKWPRCCNVQCVSVVRKERCCVSNGPDSRQTNSRMATF
ncbi:Uncharacterized protein APZ42_005004 [Daphnia magna]|uniref:Uncharacterized protein n=1 Tax=Daphnia magna TaxID=35525 RepID=A0A164GQ93_9CRUS|nr:Uncharacterized protein APZ42_005004 [Daphnia magna]